MFALNTVLFPGLTTPLHVFEERYRALMRHLLQIEDPAGRSAFLSTVRSPGAR